MPWISLTKEHIQSRLASHELDAIEDTGGGSGDRLSGIIEQVTFLVRSKVAGCHKNILGTTGTIPDECLHAAATLAKHDIRASLGSNTEDTELMRDEYRNANQFLDKVATCDIGINDTGNAETVDEAESGCYGGDATLVF
jgi:hypothetical protein